MEGQYESPGDPRPRAAAPRGIKFPISDPTITTLSTQAVTASPFFFVLYLSIQCADDELDRLRRGSTFVEMR